MSDFESHQDDYEPDGKPDDLPASDVAVDEDVERDEPAKKDEPDDDDATPSPGSTSDQFKEKPEDSEVDQIEKERAERLDADNRPDNVEVDNTDRTFDPEKGMFTDQDGYDEAEKTFPAPGEQEG